MQISQQDRFRLTTSLLAARNALEAESYDSFEFHMQRLTGLYAHVRGYDVAPPPAPRGGAQRAPLDAEICLGLAKAA